MPVTPRVTNAHRLPLLSTCCEWRLFWQPSDREHDEWVADYNDYRFIPQGHRGLSIFQTPAWACLARLYLDALQAAP